MINRQSKKKNRLIAVFLAVFLGILGADRFYLGKTKTAILKLVTFGGLTIWWFIDAALLMIDAFLYSLGKDTGFVKDNKGQELAHGLSMFRLKNGTLQMDWFANEEVEITSNKTAETQTEQPQAGKQQVRKITYTITTRQGTSSSSSSFRGTSTSTTTRTFGTKAGDGKVVSRLADLSSLSDRTHVRFQGQISSQNQRLSHTFAAFVKEEFRGLDNNDNPVWQVSNVETPPLLIEFTDGVVQLVNDDYGLTITATEHSVNGYVQGRPLYYPQEDNLIYDEVQGKFSQRMCGLELGDEVIVSGVVQQTETTIVILVENVARVG